MHKALREVLGAHVQQKGSQVDPDKTRFDFAHNAPVTDDEIRQIEAIVNAEILANAGTQARVHGHRRRPEDRRDDAVRREVRRRRARARHRLAPRNCAAAPTCPRTGDIGLFKIAVGSGVAAGVRRIEAVTGDGALALAAVAGSHGRWRGRRAARPRPARSRPDRPACRSNCVRWRRNSPASRASWPPARATSCWTQAVDVKGPKVLAARWKAPTSPTLRETMDKLKDKLKTAAIVLAAVDDGKVHADRWRHRPT